MEALPAFPSAPVNFLFPAFWYAADGLVSRKAQERRPSPTDAQSRCAPSPSCSPSSLCYLPFPVKALGPRLPAFHCLSLVVARVKHLLSVNTAQLTQELFFLSDRGVCTLHPSHQGPRSPPSCTGRLFSRSHSSRSAVRLSSSPSSASSSCSSVPSPSLLRRCGLCPGVDFREHLAGLLLDFLLLRSGEESREAQASVLLQIRLLSRALALQKHLHARVLSQRKDVSP
ncbi:conserved hypothetical protein [Neospora caninum Liverpool]|nr:conserved hypothetical protein [Neospora caninum Liverpool]CBZ55446.1 conserved hypothetical protein [Neospora caninum Liverpool]|eukprot:XP_003885474.1 conserved hypothetical protein [Neospora caninum Liverpool]